MSVTEEFIEYLTEGAVAIEVYGHRQADPARNPALWDLSIIQAKTRTLRDRYTRSRPHTQPQAHTHKHTDRQTQTDTHMHMMEHT